MKEKIFLDPNFFEFLSQRGKDFNEVFSKIRNLEKFATDVKALQEIVYRYHLMDETEKGYEKAMSIRKEFEILPVTERDLDTQESLLERYPTARPRELLHVAVMINNNIKKIVCSPDSNYQDIEDVEVKNIISKVIDI